jgi:hypothetical protein
MVSNLLCILYIQYWCIDGKYRIYVARKANLSIRFVPSHINSIFTVNIPILYLSCNKICKKYVIQFDNKLEAQWAEPVSLTFHSALRKLYTEPSNQNLVHLDTRFQIRFFRNNQKKELLMVAMFVNRSGRNEQS